MTGCPEILAPAGDKESFLAAISAGADAIYCGLKELNARMEAKNFTLEELYALNELAKRDNIKVYVAINSLIRTHEISYLANILKNLKKIPIDGIIVQDLGVIKIIKELDYSVEIHLSTLSNFSLTSSLRIGKKLGVKRIVLPRELSIDEIKTIDQNSDGIWLEVFVHGALCYSVSGRCYWSSMLGGKSALRGKCVQPCRRIYKINSKSGRFFSCMDLGLDVLTKLLLPLSNVKAWKIEGRKKGPHYVFYTTKAYKILRDNHKDPKAKKMALELLKESFGRERTHYFFLSHRPYCPIDPSKETASGLYIGNVGKDKKGKYYLRPRTSLLPKDVLRFGYQDQSHHFLMKINQFISKGKKLVLKENMKNLKTPTPVFLIDRREKELRKMITNLNNQLNQIRLNTSNSIKNFNLLKEFRKNKLPQIHIHVFFEPIPKKHRYKNCALWIEKDHMGINTHRYNWIWLPPVIWPEDEEEWKKKIKSLLNNGIKNFIVNSISHLGLFPKDTDFKKLNLWAGPFCNITNPLSTEMFKLLGFKGIIPSFELPEKDLLSFPKHSPIKVGIIIWGLIPFSISRTLFREVKTKHPIISPRKEVFWVEKKGSNYYLYPAWNYDITDKKEELIMAGYSLFLHLHKKVPDNIKIKNRKFMFNWNLEI